MVIVTATSIFNYGFTLWWIPMLGGIFSIGGLIYEKNHALDIGIFISGSSFFYFMHLRDLPLTYGNLLFILVIFFLYFGLWSFMRRAVLIKNIEHDIEGVEEQNFLIEYKEHSAHRLLFSLLLGWLVASIGSFVALYSFVGPFPSGMIVFLMILFGSAFVFSVYLVVVLLPKYFTVKESR